MPDTKQILLLLMLLLLVATIGLAQSSKQVAEFALIGSTVLDIHSSWDRLEGNPILRNGNNRFGGKGLAIKSALLGSVLYTQHKTPQHKKLWLVVNYIATGVIVSVAIHNYRAERWRYR